MNNKTIIKEFRDGKVIKLTTGKKTQMAKSEKQKECKKVGIMKTKRILYYW